jgi:hypothetical protein
MLYLFISCISAPPNPYDPSNTKLNLTLESSSGVIIADTLVDSVGNTIKVGITTNFPDYVDSIGITVFTSDGINDIDTVLKNMLPLQNQDTLWYRAAFATSGKRTIMAMAFARGNKKTTLGYINILNKPVPHTWPHLVINGTKNITVAQICSLSVSALDSNSAQLHSFYVKQDTVSFTQFTPPFKWAPPTGFTGTHQVFFKVTDTDSPSYFDTATVTIAVSDTSRATIADSVGPVFFPKSGPANNAIVIDSSVNIVDSIYDPSGIDSVYWTLNGKTPKSLTFVAGSTNLYSLIDTLRRFHLDTIVIFAQDKSTNRNKSNQTIVLNYNVPPVINDTAVSTNRNVAKTWTLNALSVDGDALTWSRLTSPPSALSGTVTGTLPSVIFTPAANWSGVDSFKVQVTDGHWSDTAKIKITVIAINRPPTVILKNPSIGAMAIAKSINFAWSGSDADNDPLSYTLYVGLDTLNMISVYTGVDTSYNYSAVNGNKYYWKIGVSDGKTSVISAILSFMVNTPPQVTLNLPANGAVGLSMPVAFSWNTSDVDIGDAGQLRSDFYCAEIDSPLTRKIKDTTATVCILANLKCSRTYQWKVVVKDGKDSTTSPVIQFSTLVPSTKLASLQLLNSTNMTPIFQASILEYKTSFSYDIDSISLIPITEDSLAVMTINNNITKSSKLTTVKNLPVGFDTILIRVAARDGSATVSYGLIVSREKPITFQQYYGQSNTDFGTDVLGTPDSGVMACGSINNSSSAGFIRIVKTDKLGTQLWSQQYGTSSPYGTGVSLANAQNGNTISLSFWTQIDSNIVPHVWLFEIDKNGLMQWNKIFRANGYGYDQEFPRALIRTNDNGYLIAARVISTNLGRGDIWLIKTTPAGIAEWDTVYSGGGSYGDVSSISQTSDGGYIVSGSQQSSGVGSAWLLKVNSAGKAVWSKTYSELSNGTIKGVAVSNNGDLFICGALSTNSGPNNGFIGKLNSSGIVQRITTYAGVGDQNIASIKSTTDGNYILSGWYTALNGNWDGWLLKANPNCDTLWTQKIGSPGSDYFNSVKQTYDGGYIITGYLYNSGMWILKTDRDGKLW